ncbi:Hypothetical protein CINCED_3A012808, partial [Cinara cedri]
MVARTVPSNALSTSHVCRTIATSVLNLHTKHPQFLWHVFPLHTGDFSGLSPVGLFSGTTRSKGFWLRQ